MTMNFFTKLLILALTFSSSITKAEGFYIEEEALKPVSKSVESVIRKENSRCALIGKPIDLSGHGQKSEFIATTVEGCDHGAFGGPIWIVRDGKIILSTASYAVKPMPKKRNGLFDLQLSKSSAGFSAIEFWSFTGKTYKVRQSYVFTISDKKTCLAHKEICPYQFD
jgi:hypothetical protein